MCLNCYFGNVGFVWEKNYQLEVFLEEQLSINPKDMNKLRLKFTEGFMAVLFDPESSENARFYGCIYFGRYLW